ncbi:MAG: phosphoribosylanthranilate isomerase [Acidobacteriaceae bacterium]|nr:phosphoribosylanthranilate isomerase [Acidobacteriaceae bacterium]
MTWVKICANTSAADAKLAAELGADAVGFVFAASKRQVNAEQVAAITSQLPESVERIGIFATDNAAEIIAAVSASGLSGVQMHGAVRPALIAALNEAFEGRVRLIQVVGFESGGEDAFESALRAAVAQPAIDAVLLDAVKSGASGGLGVTFDWETAQRIVARVWAETATEVKLIVAGGLRPENVAAAIGCFAPYGVDVASGTEASPGKKDPARLGAFLRNVRSAKS